MPIDNRAVQASYNIVKPFAYENSTSAVHPKGYSNSTRFNGSGAVSGASAGSAFGPWGAGIGAAVGLASDLWQLHAAKNAAKKANEESRRAADAASARNAAEARAARDWNSEQAQIRRMRMAGLSPGLAYGQMSPSTAQAASAEKQDVHKADTPKFDNESILHAIQLLINQQNANTQALAQQSTSELQGSQTQLNLIDKVYRGAEYQANIASVLANTSLTDAEKIKILKTLDNTVRLVGSQADAAAASARQSNATANVTEQTGVGLANSQIASNNASAAVNTQQANILKLTYELDNAQWLAVQNFMKSNGFDESLAPLVMKALSSIAERSGNTLESVLANLASIPGNLIEHYLDKLMPQYEDFTVTDEIQSGKNAHSKHTETTRGRRKK